ncbi:MAG: response regulator transcription factor [Pseudomonadota bacterium]
MTSYLILLIDDDDDLREIVTEQISTLDGNTQYSVVACANLTAGFEWLEENQPDAILLDVDLPDGNGREACARMRASDIFVPIIMLTGIEGEENIVKGLDSGANDYVTKPFRVRELVARIETHIRIHQQSEHAVHNLAQYRFHPVRKLLFNRNTGRRIKLTEKETEIIRYLMRAGGKPIGRKELLGDVWGYNAEVTTHTLETHIYRLRQKIEENPGSASLIVTTPEGYCLNMSGLDE